MFVSRCVTQNKYTSRVTFRQADAFHSTLIMALHNPKHEEHKEMRERIAPDFDPEAFEARHGHRGRAAEILAHESLGSASSRGGAISTITAAVSRGETQGKIQ
jgi:hypothetical protein